MVPVCFGEIVAVMGHTFEFQRKRNSNVRARLLRCILPYVSATARYQAERQGHVN